MLFIDSETMGFIGPAVIWQYAEDYGEIKIHDVWLRPIRESLKILERFCEYDVCAFNLVFDWFHVVKQYNVLKRMRFLGLPPNPRDYWEIERKNPCDVFMRPKSAFDLMIYCQAKRFQHLMPRDSIYMKRVPRLLAYRLARELEANLYLEEGLFGGFKKGREKRWIIEELADPHPELVNIKCTLNPSRKLDVIAKAVLGEGKAPAFWDQLPAIDELPYRPYGGLWVEYAEFFIQFWKSHEQARFYAYRDVEILQRLYKAFDEPPSGDVNSELTVCVANTRWKGMAVDQEKIDGVIEENRAEVERCPLNLHSSKQVLAFVRAKMEPMQRAVVKSTGADVLSQLIAKRRKGWERCQYVIDMRKKISLAKNFKKMQISGRFHPSFGIVGTLSNRMAGSGKFNPQGIQKGVRHCFPLKDSHETLGGGDFDGFEIGIACAVYNDPVLQADFLSGKKMHAIMAESIFDRPYSEILLTEKGICGVCHGSGSVTLSDQETYEQVQKYVEQDWQGGVLTQACLFCDGTGKVKDLYGLGKGAFFASMYGAREHKLSMVTGLPVEQMRDRLEVYQDRYPVMAAHKVKLGKKMAALYTIGEKRAIYWRDPQTYIRSLLGWERNFDVEYRVIHHLFELALNPPEEWRRFNTVQVVRRGDRTQSAVGATRSAIFGAAFGIQSQIIRQAGNHEIQSTGAEITKGLQLRLWQAQPIGIAPPRVSILNVHDELMAVTPGTDLTDEVNTCIEEYRGTVPLLSMTWKHDIQNWAER